MIQPKILLKGSWPKGSAVTFQMNDNTCILMTDVCFVQGLPGSPGSSGPPGKEGASVSKSEFYTETYEFNINNLYRLYVRTQIFPSFSFCAVYDINYT